MAVADGSQVRLADVSESTIGTTPTTPTFQVMRYVSSDLRPRKQTDVTDEVRADRNVPGITDVGRQVEGNINTRFSYGTYDTWLSRLFAANWNTNTLVNGVTHLSGTLEQFYEQGATDSFVRFTGCRWNSLEMTLEARQPVRCVWGVMGLAAPAPDSTIITGATYTDPTTTEEFNAALNVANLTMSGVVASPKVQSLTIRITNNIYANDVIGSYNTYSHGFGRFEVSGSLNTYFESLDVYSAILNHDTVGLSFDLLDAAGNKYTFQIPKIKLMDGGPAAPGNSRAVMLDVPFQGFFDATTSGTMKITRTPASP